MYPNIALMKAMSMGEVAVNGSFTPPTPTTDTVTIISQPNDATAYVGGEFSFITVADTDDPTATLSYQWQIDVDSTWTDISGATHATYVGTAPETTGTADYRCVVTSTGGGTATTDTATLTVSADTVSIITNPSDATVYVGGTASVTCEASSDAQGAVLSYQWQVQSSQAPYHYSDISGATSATYSGIDTSSTGSQTFRCIVTSSYGGTATTTSATITVAQLPKAINLNATKIATNINTITVEASLTQTTSSTVYLDLSSSYYDFDNSIENTVTATVSGTSVTVTVPKSGDVTYYRLRYTEDGNTIYSDIGTAIEFDKVESSLEMPTYSNNVATVHYYVGMGPMIETETSFIWSLSVGLYVDDVLDTSIEPWEGADSDYTASITTGTHHTLSLKQKFTFGSDVTVQGTLTKPTIYRDEVVYGDFASIVKLLPYTGSPITWTPYLNRATVGPSVVHPKLPFSYNDYTKIATAVTSNAFAVALNDSIYINNTSTVSNLQSKCDHNLQFAIKLKGTYYDTEIESVVDWLSELIPIDFDTSSETYEVIDTLNAHQISGIELYAKGTWTASSGNVPMALWKMELNK